MPNVRNICKSEIFEPGAMFNENIQSEVTDIINSVKFDFFVILELAMLRQKLIRELINGHQGGNFQSQLNRLQLSAAGVAYGVFP